MNSFETISHLSDDINSEVNKISFGENINIIHVDNQTKYQEVIDSGLGFDYRAKNENSDKIVSVFEGLDFDKNKIRTQSYFLKDREKIAAIMTFAIIPQKISKEQRYFKKAEGGIEVCDFNSLYVDIPEFIISPAWTKVDPKYLTKFAVPGFKLFKNILQILENKSPGNTWLEVSARGTYPTRDILEKFLKEKDVGVFISNEKLPFNINMFGVASNESESTVKMARLLNIPQLQDIATTTLGPVFSKKARS